MTCARDGWDQERAHSRRAGAHEVGGRARGELARTRRVGAHEVGGRAHEAGRRSRGGAWLCLRARGAHGKAQDCLVHCACTRARTVVDAVMRVRQEKVEAAQRKGRWPVRVERQRVQLHLLPPRERCRHHLARPLHRPSARPPPAARRPHPRPPFSIPRASTSGIVVSIAPRLLARDEEAEQALVVEDVGREPGRQRAHAGERLRLRLHRELVQVRHAVEKPRAPLLTSSVKLIGQPASVLVPGPLPHFP